MNVSVDDVQKIAELARIEVTNQEKSRLAETISVVFDYMKGLNEVPTDGVAPTYHSVDICNVVRDDVVVEYSDTQMLIDCFPEKVGRELLVPGVFNN